MKNSQPQGRPMAFIAGYSRPYKSRLGSIENDEFEKYMEDQSYKIQKKVFCTTESQHEIIYHTKIKHPAINNAEIYKKYFRLQVDLNNRPPAKV